MVSTPLKNINQLGRLFPIYGKIKMFQTTNHSSIVHFTSFDTFLQNRRSTLHTPHFTLRSSHSRLYTLHSTLYTSLQTPHSTPHSTLHTSHATLYTRYTTHSPHFTLHTLHTLHSTLCPPHSTPLRVFPQTNLMVSSMVCNMA